MNWRGRPLTSHEVVIELIGATTTRAGLTMHAEADTNSYPRKIKISDAEMAMVTRQIKPDAFHGEWNYTIRPAKRTTTMQLTCLTYFLASPKHWVLGLI